MAVKRKEESIETLRGIAIILMVAGHVIGLRNTGLRVDDDSVWRYIYYSFEYLRMPLFTSISGYVYAIKPVKKEHVLKFFKGKSRRILLPFISVATVQFVLNSFIPNVNNPTSLTGLWKIYIFGYGQFWFLQALFLVFISIIFLEFYGIINNIKGWLISLAVSIIALLQIATIIGIDLFSFTHFLYLLPFFLLGIGIKRFSKIIYHKKVFIIVLIILFTGIVVQQLNWFNFLEIPIRKFSYLGVFVGLTGIYVIFKIRNTNNYLADLGYYAYGIYLFHVFGTAGSRIVSKFFGIESLFLLFIIGMVFGLGIPIILEKYVLLKIPILKRAFLGLA